MSNLVELQWAGFKKACVPVGASKGQILAMRQAFFGGALVMFNAVNDIGDLSEKDAMEAMHHLAEAMQTFKDEARAMAEKFDKAAH